MTKPQIGDKIIVEFEVTGNYNLDSGVVEVKWPTSGKRVNVDVNSIKEIIFKPWEPELGSIVHQINDILPNFHYKVLAIHGSGERMTGGRTRRWVIAAHKDDIPVSFWIGSLEPVKGDE